MRYDTEEFCALAIELLELLVCMLKLSIDACGQALLLFQFAIGLLERSGFILKFCQCIGKLNVTETVDFLFTQLLLDFVPYLHDRNEFFGIVGKNLAA